MAPGSPSQGPPVDTPGPRPLYARAGILSHQVCLGALLPASTRDAAGSSSLTPSVPTTAVPATPSALRGLMPACPACRPALLPPSGDLNCTISNQPGTPALGGVPVQVCPASSSGPQPRPHILHLLFYQNSVSQFPSISPPDLAEANPTSELRTQAWPSKALDMLMGSEEGLMRGLAGGYR